MTLSAFFVDSEKELKRGKKKRTFPFIWTENSLKKLRKTF